MTAKRTPVSKSGEFGLIDHLAEKIKGSDFIHPVGHITEKKQGYNLITSKGTPVNINQVFSSPDNTSF